MTNTFDPKLPPFSLLSEEQQWQLTNSIDIEYYRQDEVLQTTASNPLMILFKGYIEEQEGEEILTHYAPGDIISPFVLAYPQRRFLILEDTLCYQIPNALFTDLLKQNRDFARYFSTDLGTHHHLMHQASQQQNLAEFILTTITEHNIQPHLMLPPDAGLLKATQLMAEHDQDAALIYHPDTEQLGIITRTDLLHASMLQQASPDSPAYKIATYPVICVELGEYLFTAMIEMTQKKVKRVVVKQEQQVMGMLSLIQLLSMFSTHSHVLGLQIARATTIDELTASTQQQRELVATLFNNGIHSHFIMSLIAVINEQIIEKAFSLIVPREHHAYCCFFVMGSEGRGEQILKTDQDNGLIVSDGYDWPERQAVMTQLCDTLAELGYPHCDGGVMATNTDWAKTESEWLQTLETYQQDATPEHALNLSIFADAKAVAGNPELFDTIKAKIRQPHKGQSLLLNTLVRAALTTHQPLTLFGGLKQQPTLDIKKAGIFPIVHGVRTLALEHHLAETNTLTRIATLQQQEVIAATTADELTEAFKLFIRLRLMQQLSEQSTLSTQALSHLDRDLVRKGLHAVKAFKHWLGYHYQVRD